MVTSLPVSPKAGGPAVRWALVPTADAPVALTRAEGRWQHRGTIAVRGPCAPDWGRHGLGDAEARALEFTAAWFGGPFDGVNLRAGRRLTWGLWHHSGGALAEVLARFRDAAPGAYQALLGRRGLGAAAEAGPRGRVSWELALSPAAGAPLRGRAAEAAVSSDAQLVAALACAAGEEEARDAQVEVMIRRSYLPLLRAPVPARGGAGASSLGRLLRGPRELAFALVLELSGGRAGVADFARTLGGIDHRGPIEERERAVEDRMRAWAERLAEVGRSTDASRLWRVLASPELRARRVVLVHA